MDLSDETKIVDNIAAGFKSGLIKMSKSQVSRETGISPSHLSKIFSHETGMDLRKLRLICKTAGVRPASARQKQIEDGTSCERERRKIKFARYLKKEYLKYFQKTY